MKFTDQMWGAEDRGELVLIIYKRVMETMAISKVTGG